MRTTIAVLLLVLFPFAACTAKDCDPNPQQPSTVTIDVSPADGTATPDVCHVKKGSTVKWKSKKSFQTNFASSPETSGKKEFKSHQNWFHQQAEMQAEVVGDFPYTVTVQGVTADPSVIIDP